MTPSRRRPGPDSTLDDVRERLIRAGTDLLQARGVDLGLADVPLSDAIAEAGVTRSTAYRSLADDDLAPQAKLHRELLTQLLSRYTRGDTRTVLESEVAAELERNEHVLASGSTAERTAVMRSIIRIGCNISYQRLIESPERAILTAMYGALRSSPTPADWRHQALAEGERRLNELFTELYTGLAAIFQYRISHPFTMAQFAAAAASLIEGLAMRHDFNDEVTTLRMLNTGPDGASEEWSLFAIAFQAMFIGMFEPENAQDPYADLTRY